MLKIILSDITICPVKIKFNLKIIVTEGILVLIFSKEKEKNLQKSRLGENVNSGF